MSLTFAAEMPTFPSGCVHLESRAGLVKLRLGQLGLWKTAFQEPRSPRPAQVCRAWVSEDRAEGVGIRVWGEQALREGEPSCSGLQIDKASLLRSPGCRRIRKVKHSFALRYSE